MSATRLAFGPFVLDPARGTLTRDGHPVAVGTKGLLLLRALALAPGRVLGKSELMDTAWSDAAVEESNLSVQIAALRKLLGPSPGGEDWIVTVPRAGYRFVGTVVPMDDTPQSAPTTASEPQPRPSVAVLPFANLSGDKEQEYFVDGIAEDILTALTRFRWFRVVARHASFSYKDKAADANQIARDLGVRYLLEGSVRKSAQRVRISVQLIDAASARHLWAEKYDLDLTEAFAVQDAIAERVAGAIEPELLKTESLPVAATHTGNMTAWDLVRQGTWLFHHVGRETHLKARELFRQACRTDPRLAEAQLWLARVNAGIVAYGWAASPEDDIREGLDAAVRAIHLDEKNPYSHYALAIVSAYANAPEQAVLAAEKAVEISPSFALGHLVLGMARLFRGQAREAVVPLEHGLTLNAYDPQNFVWYNLLALARYFSGEAEPALAAAIKAMKIRPGWPPTLATLALCQAALGEVDAAHKSVEEMRKLPAPPGDILAPLKARNPGWARQMAAVIGMAGGERPAN